MRNDIKKIIRQVYVQAQQIDSCAKFKGTEDLEGIAKLFKSSQGIEFCINKHFPNMATFRLFKPFGMEKYGIYIDAGNITLKNPDSVILIGRTQAQVDCDTNVRHEVIVMHGAKALVNASNWAVVFTKVGNGSICIKNTSDNAMIL